MAVSCPEVMYGAYYPYLYGRAGPSRSFYQYERVCVNEILYSLFFLSFFFEIYLKINTPRNLAQLRVYDKLNDKM